MTNSPFHDPQGNPLPDANDIEQETSRGLEPASFYEGSQANGPSPHIKQDIKRLRNVFIGLLLTGIVLGCIASVGVAIILRRTGLLDAPNQNQGVQEVPAHYLSLKEQAPLFFDTSR